MNIFAKLKSWVLNIVRRFKKAPAQIDPPAAATDKRRSPKAKRLHNKERKNNIADLLGSLDHTFKEMQRADNSWSRTDRLTRKNLRAMGPVVPYGEWDVPSTIQHPDKLPAMAFASTAFTHGDEDTFFAQFAYAVKVNRFRGGLTQFDGGVKYECGVCYTTADRKENDGKEDKLSLWWMAFNVVVDPVTGEITVCRTVQSRYYRNAKNSRAVGFRRREWGLPDGATEEKVSAIIAVALNLTTAKNDNWSISVRKDGQRATFIIPDNQAKDFFNDREKVYVDGGSGRMRPIMHIVAGHQRKYKSGKVADVPTHIRGLRQFVWNGFECSISTPQFHTFQSQTFTAASIDLEELKEKPSDAYIENMGEVLATLEDSQDRKTADNVLQFRRLNQQPQSRRLKTG